MKLSFVATNNELALSSKKVLVEKYGDHSPETADAIVTIGGDGMVLKSLYKAIDHQKPVFPLRCTRSVGFLCNKYNVDGLEERIQKANRVNLRPLKVSCTSMDGTKREMTAINEVTLIRESLQCLKLKISVDGVTRIECYSGDGLLVATAAGSTAYNRSAGGPILPLESNLLVMTAICGFLPKKWSYALLAQTSVVDIEVIEPSDRLVRVESGIDTMQKVISAQISLDEKKSVTILFDPDQNLQERILREQFSTT